MSKPAPHLPRILIAEDMASMASMMRTLLSSRGYPVEVAADGLECLAKVQAWRPALIILDIMMPKMHGIEVLRRLRAEAATRDIGVIVCTARRYKSDQDQARELGAFSVLTKPFEKEELFKAIDSYFSGAARSQSPSGPVSAAEPYRPLITPGRCYFRLWGTRGSIPVSGQRYVRHGGNTSCLEVSCGEESVIVDAGSGIRQLGLKLAKQGPRKLHILITHTHWDHIQGFPFFAPAYLPGFELVIYGALGFKKDLRSIFRGQLDRDYFPVQFEDMRASIEFRSLEGSSLRIGCFDISWEFTHHPAATVGFKFAVQGKSLAYISDNEFLPGYLGPPHGIGSESELVAPHRRLVEFARNVDLLIAEAQYTNEEYESKIGWGHSSVSNACLFSRLAGAKRWIVIHHDPSHEDEFLDDKLNLTKEILRSLDYPIEVSHGYDGFTEYL